MSYGVGVDLGTTFTAAAVCQAGGQAEMITLGHGRFAVPSAIFALPDAEVLVGNVAVDRGRKEPGRLAVEFKRRLGDSTPILLGGAAYSADRLSGELLRWTLDAVAERQGEPAADVVVTHPANWGEFRRDMMRSAVEHGGVGDAILLTEPEAAALHYASRERVEPGELVAVYDLGGGTFDAVVLERTGDGFAMRGTPRGIERLGGVDLDHTVRGMVIEHLTTDLTALDLNDPSVAADLHDLHIQCIQAKIALSSDLVTNVRVRLADERADIRLTRTDFEERARPTLGASVEALASTISDAGVAPSEIAKVLLVGGSSRIPLVAEMVFQALGRPVAVDTDPKAAVALGAAMVSSGRGIDTEHTAPPVTEDTDESQSPVESHVDNPPAQPDDRAAPPPPTPHDGTESGPDETARARPVPPTPTDPPERRRHLVAGLAGALLIALVAAVLLWPDSGDEVVDRGSTTSDTTVVEDRAVEVVATINVGSEPRVPVELAGALWNPSAAAGTVTAIDVRTLEVLATLDLEPGLGAPQRIDGMLWAPNRVEGTVSIIDPSTLQTVDTFVAGGGATHLREAGGLVWSSNFRDNEVAAIDPDTFQVVQTVPVGSRPFPAAEANGLLWVPDRTDGTMTIVDPTTFETETIPVGEGLQRPTFAFGFLWVVDVPREELVTIDTETQQIVGRLDIGVRAGFPVEFDGLLWLSNSGDGTVSVIDPARREVVDTVQAGSAPQPPAAVGDLLWVPDRGEGTVIAIDPATRRVVETIDVGGEPGAAVEAGGLIWVRDLAGDTVVAIDPDAGQ